MKDDGLPNWQTRRILFRRRGVDRNLAGSPISITLTIGDGSGTATAQALDE